jgi:hypothetical protein
LIEIKEGASDAQKVAVFAILNEGNLSLKALALGIATYRGVMPIPGIGMIQAVGQANFII